VHVRVTAKELAQARASEVLAIDERVFGGSVRLPDAEPKTEMRRREPQTEAASGAKAQAVEPGSLVAIVMIEGPLAQRAVSDLCAYVDGYDAINSRVGAALSDPSVGAVVLRIDSPGGDAAGLEEAVTRMQDARKKSGKPVYAYVDELAASAAYWIAAAVADQGVYVPGAGLVGSIGCIGAMVDQTGALEQAGFKVTLVRDPAGKAESHPLGPISDLSLERTTALVSAVADRFVKAMAAARGLKPKAIRGFNGAVFGGQSAVDEGLANGVASLEQVVAMAQTAIDERKGNGMDTKAKLGLKEDATPAEVQAALDTEIADAKLGRSVRTKLGASTAAETEARVDELVQTHAAADVAKKKNEQELKARAKVERNGLVAKLVHLGKETPATAWTDASARELEPKGSLATMPLDELRERVETFEKEPRALAKKTPEHVEGEALSAKEIARLKAKGIDPQKYAATKAEMNRKKGGPRAAEAS
jgi:ClpP class serine protease